MLGLLGRFDSRRRHLLPGDGGAGGGGNDAADGAFVFGDADASEHDITITACNNAGFALPFTGGAGFTIYILFAALMLGMGVYFCKNPR